MRYLHLVVSCFRKACESQKKLELLNLHLRRCHLQASLRWSRYWHFSLDQLRLSLLDWQAQICHRAQQYWNQLDWVWVAWVDNSGSCHQKGSNQHLERQVSLQSLEHLHTSEAQTLPAVLDLMVAASYWRYLRDDYQYLNHFAGQSLSSSIRCILVDP